MRVNKYVCLSETAAILVLLLLEESLSDMAGHPPGSNCLMPVSEQTCSEPLSPDVHLPSSAASCPVYFGGYNFPSSTALLDSLSFTLPSNVSISAPLSPCQPQASASPAEHCWRGLSLHCCHDAVGASPELLSQDLTNLLLRKARRARK